jgi:hypothetical protein
VLIVIPFADRNITNNSWPTSFIPSLGIEIFTEAQSWRGVSGVYNQRQGGGVGRARVAFAVCLHNVVRCGIFQPGIIFHRGGGGSGRAASRRAWVSFIKVRRDR